MGVMDEDAYVARLSRMMTAATMLIKNRLTMAIIVSDMARQEDVTEALKAADQMEWVRRMNSIRSRAEEIILTELVYG